MQTRSLGLASKLAKLVHEHLLLIGRDDGIAEEDDTSLGPVESSATECQPSCTPPKRPIQSRHSHEPTQSLQLGIILQHLPNIQHGLPIGRMRPELGTDSRVGLEVRVCSEVRSRDRGVDEAVSLQLELEGLDCVGRGLGLGLSGDRSHGGIDLRLEGAGVGFSIWN